MQIKDNSTITENNPKIRQIKLQPLHRTGNLPPVPFLRLSGKWLEEGGFQIYGFANITILDNQLVIRPMNKPTKNK